MEFTIPLNKFEKRDLVIKLHKEGHTYREIAHLAHISPRDIKPILRKYEIQLENNKTKGNNEQTTPKKESLTTQAFKLFQEGKKPTEVAIELNISFRKAKKFWFQFLNLERMEECYELYKGFRYDIPNLLTIANFMNRNNLSGTNIVNVLRTANNVINLNKINSNLKNEIERLQKMKNNNYSSNQINKFQPIPPLGLPKHYYQY